MKLILTCLLTAMTVTSSAIEIEPYYDADLPNPAINITKDEQGNFLEVTVNEWHDKVYVQGEYKNYVFHQGYDYSKKQGFIRTYSDDMQLINETYSHQNDGMVVREEMMQAFEIFKSNETVLQLLVTAEQAITIHGGFNYEDPKEDQPCFVGNRCVHVFASTPNVPVLAHAIIKLVDQSVPYPLYDMDAAVLARIKVDQNK